MIGWFGRYVDRRLSAVRSLEQQVRKLKRQLSDAEKDVESYRSRLAELHADWNAERLVLETEIATLKAVQSVDRNAIDLQEARIATFLAVEQKRAEIAAIEAEKAKR